MFMDMDMYTGKKNSLIKLQIETFTEHSWKCVEIKVLMTHMAMTCTDMTEDVKRLTKR